MLATSAVLLRTVDPHRPGAYPLCPFHAATGLWCPGCGSLRAMNDLLHGRVAEAAGHNVLAMLAVPLVVVLLLEIVFASRSRPVARSRRPVAPSWSPAAVGAVLLLWWVARNLPPFSALAP